MVLKKGIFEHQWEKHLEMPKINRYLTKTNKSLIPHLTLSCILSWKEGWLVSPRAWWKKSGFFAVNLAMVKPLLSDIANLPEEFLNAVKSQIR